MSGTYASKAYSGGIAQAERKMDSVDSFIRTLYRAYTGNVMNAEFVLHNFGMTETKLALLYVVNPEHRYILKRNWRNKVLSSHRSIILNEVLAIARCVDDAYDYVRFMIRNKDVR
jgi:hypothetical protein